MRDRLLFWISSLLMFSVVIHAENYLDTKAERIVAILNKMTSYMDEEVEPCQNFRNYSVEYVERVDLPLLMSEFIALLEDLKNQTFKNGSVEEKMLQFYDICLKTEPRTNYDGIKKEYTLKKLERKFRTSNLINFVNYYYRRFIKPDTKAKFIDWGSFAEFLELLKTFNAGDWTDNSEIESAFINSMYFPKAKIVQDCIYDVNFFFGIAINLLYEENVLGPLKQSQYQFQVKKIFDAIRQQVNASLQSNPLNWTMSEIDALRQNINSLTLSIGSIPENVNRREFVTDYYKNLQFSAEDSYRDALSKLGGFRYWKGENFIRPRHTTVFRSRKSIVVSYHLLANSTFELETHDLFKMTPLGIQLAFHMLNSYRPENCYDYNDTGPRIFGDYQVNELNNFCWKLYANDKSLAKQHTILLLLKLVHESYFASDSKFNQTQPSFTAKTLSQLSFLRLAQSSTQLFGFQEELLNNLLPKLPSFAQAFNCPNSE